MSTLPLTSLLLFFILACLLTPIQPTSVFVSVSPRTINTYATYSFLFSDTGAYSQTGVARVQFQSPPYTLANDTNLTSCIDFNRGTVLNCYAESSSVLAFNWNNTIPADGLTDSLSFSVTLLNPPYVDNFTFTYSYTLTSGTLYSSASNTIRNLSPATLTSCSVSFSPSTTNTASTATVALTTTNAIPVGGSLILTVTAYTLSANSLTSTTTTNSTLLNSAVVPTYNSQTYFYSGIVIGAISAAASLSLGMTTVQTPPSTRSSYYNLAATTTYTANSLNTIDTGTCYISGITDTSIVSLTFTVTGNFLVGDSKSAVVSFTAPTTIDLSTDTITVSPDSSSTSYLSVYTSSGGQAIITGVSNVLSVANTSSGVSLPSVASSDTLTSGGTVSISLGVKITSLINSGTKTLYLQLLRSGYSYANNLATITILPDTLSSASYSSLSNIVSATTQYNFTIVNANPLGVGAVVTITLPSALTIADGSCTVAVSSSMGGAVSSNYSCTASSNLVTVSNIIQNVIPAGTTLSMAISNIVNPISSSTTSSILIQTYYSSSELTSSVDNSTGVSGLTVTATPATIPNANLAVSRSSTTNLAQATFTLTYTLATGLAAGGYVTLSLPSDMPLSSPNTATYTATYSNGTVAVSSTTITATNTVSTDSIITLNLTSLGSNLPASTVLVFTLSTVQNYFSLKPVNGQVTSYTSVGNMIEQSATDALTITNTAEDTTLTVTDTTSSRINGASLNYTFSLAAPAALGAADTLTMTIANTGNSNNQLYLAASPTCTVDSTAAICTAISQTLTLTIGKTISASTSFTISVNSITLTRSIQTPSAITFQLKEESSGSYYAITTATLTPSINTLPNSITSLSLTIDENGGAAPSQLNQLQQFALTVAPSNRLLAGDIIVVTVPSQYLYVGSMVVVGDSTDLTTATGSLCSNSPTLFCSHNDSSSPNLIRVREKVAGNVFSNVSSVSFIINNGTYRSPQDWTTFDSTPYLATTYANGNYEVDTVDSSTGSNATFYLSCPNATTYHCKTCAATGLCTGCYQVGDGYDSTFAYGGYYYQTSDGLCVTSCGDTYFNQSNVCVACTQPCYGCDGSSTYCTSCIATSTYYLYNNTCRVDCPPSYYASTTECLACDSNCLTCDSLSTNCTSCSGLFLSSSLGVCVTADLCASTEYADTATNECTACDASCSSCETASTNCTVCASGYIIDSVYGTTLPGRCTDQCPTGTVNDTANQVGGGCTCNTTVCATCQTTINTCLTCSGSLLLLSSSCVSDCGSGYFNSSGTCTTCGSNCTTCTDASTCTECGNSMKVYNGGCWSTCPTFTTAGIQTGTTIAICIYCGDGCTNCINSTFCDTCTANWLLQSTTAGVQACTTACSSGYNEYLETECLTTCPGLYSAVNGVCVLSTNQTTVTSTSNIQNTKSVPFPVTIGLAVFVIAVLASKVALPTTIVPAGLCAFAGLAEAITWFIFIAVVSAEDNPEDYPKSKIGSYIVVIALLATLLLNIINICFFKNYLWEDGRVQNHIKKLRNKTKCGICFTNFCLVLSVCTSHKWIQILFSNLFEVRFFTFKVEDKLKMTPFNYVRYFSILPSLIAIAGASIASLEHQPSKMGSLVFVQSIDLIIVTILAGIVGLWVTVRKSDDYENVLADTKYDMEDELDRQPVEDDFFQEEEEQKQGNNSVKYKHTSSIYNKKQRSNTDKPEDPLSKKNTRRRVNPIGEEVNNTGVPLDITDEDESNLGQNLNSIKVDAKPKRITKGVDLDEIGLYEESGDQLLPQRGGRNKAKPVGQGNNRYKQSDPKKTKIKDEVQTKLTPNQIQQTRVVKDVDHIDTVILENDKISQSSSQTHIKAMNKNDMKKEKLQMLNKSSEEELSKLSEVDREKAGEMRTAMNLLEAKKVDVGVYLEYLDIIEEEDEDRDSEDYQTKPVQKPGSKIRKGSRGSKGQHRNKGSSTHGRIHKAVQRQDRSARLGKADDLFVNPNVMHDTFEEQIQPQPASFDTPARPRQYSETGMLRKQEQSAQNRSDHNFAKTKGVSDMVLVSMESGDNYDRSLGEQFQRGNTLQQVDRDELPPSNMYATERVVANSNGLRASANIPPSKDRIVPNKLINDQDQIEYLESDAADLETLKDQLVDFHQEINPNQFDEPHLCISNEKSSDAPDKPTVNREVKEEKPKDQVLQIEDIQDDIQGYDQFEGAYEGQMPSKLKRYQSNQAMLDYDEIMYQKRNKQRMKQLEKIYLPRLDVGKPQPRRKGRHNHTSHSHHKD